MLSVSTLNNLSLGKPNACRGYLVTKKVLLAERVHNKTQDLAPVTDKTQQFN